MEKSTSTTRVAIGLVFDTVSFVRDPSCGAISTFEGTTRDHFGGKRVVELSYEAYEPMALKVLQEIADQVGTTHTHHSLPLSFFFVFLNI